jgi:hypothetical protein
MEQEGGWLQVGTGWEGLSVTGVTKGQPGKGGFPHQSGEALHRPEPGYLESEGLRWEVVVHKGKWTTGVRWVSDHTPV